MSFGSDNKKAVAFTIWADPTAAKHYPLFSPDRKVTIVGGYVVSTGAQTAGSAGKFALINAGTAGGTVANAGTIAAAVGGTAAAARLAAGVRAPFVFTAGEQVVAANEHVVIQYTEDVDTAGETPVQVVVEYVDGVGV